MRTVALRCGAWQAELAPALGGALLSLSHDGVPVLRPTDPAALAQGNVRAAACYPMIPYANRIADGRFRLDGRDYRLAANFPGSPHPLHGVGWRRPWRLGDNDGQGCRLDYEHRPDADWPFAFAARQDVRLTEDGLQLTLTLRNLEAAPRPLGAGWHPFFPRHGDDILQFRAASVWSNDQRCLPAASVPPAGDWDHAEGRAVGLLALDHDYQGWDGSAEIRGHGHRLLLRSSFTHLRVFTPPGAGYFAVEPVSHGTDAVNRGMALTAAGGTLEGSMSINLAAPR